MATAKEDAHVLLFRLDSSGNSHLDGELWRIKSSEQQDERSALNWYCIIRSRFLSRTCF